MNDVSLLVRMDEGLRDEFNAAAAASGRPAAQIVRELMREYLNQARAPGGVKPPEAVISATERQRRQEASDFARASVALEGFQRSKEAEVLTQRFVNGEIDMAAYLAPSYEDLHGR